MVLFPKLYPGVRNQGVQLLFKGGYIRLWIITWYVDGKRLPCVYIYNNASLLKDNFMCKSACMSSVSLSFSSLQIKNFLLTGRSGRNCQANPVDDRSVHRRVRPLWHHFHHQHYDHDVRPQGKTQWSCSAEGQPVNGHTHSTIARTWAQQLFTSTQWNPAQGWALGIQRSLEQNQGVYRLHSVSSTFTELVFWFTNCSHPLRVTNH